MATCTVDQLRDALNSKKLEAVRLKAEQEAQKAAQEGLTKAIDEVLKNVEEFKKDQASAEPLAKRIRELKEWIDKEFKQVEAQLGGKKGPVCEATKKVGKDLYALEQKARDAEGPLRGQRDKEVLSAERAAEKKKQAFDVLTMASIKKRVEDAKGWYEEAKKLPCTPVAEQAAKYALLKHAGDRLKFYWLTTKIDAERVDFDVPMEMAKYECDLVTAYQNWLNKESEASKARETRDHDLAEFDLEVATIAEYRKTIKDRLTAAARNAATAQECEGNE